MEASPFILIEIDKQVLIFNENLQILREQLKKKAIHDLRVAVKKLRSFLRLAEELDQINWEDAYQPIKNLFKTLGRQRDFEICLAILNDIKRKKNIEFPLFRNYLRSNLRFSRRLSENSMKNFDGRFPQTLLDPMTKVFAPLSDSKLINLVKKIALSKLNKAENLKKNFNKEAHETRKMLKDVFYWIKASPENIILNKKELALLEKILDLLGQWQDQVILLGKLRNFRKKYLLNGLEEYELSVKIGGIILRWKKEIEKTVITKCDQLIKLSAPGPD